MNFKPAVLVIQTASASLNILEHCFEYRAVVSCKSAIFHSWLDWLRFTLLTRFEVFSKFRN